MCCTYLFLANPHFNTLHLWTNLHVRQWTHIRLLNILWKYTFTLVAAQKLRLSPVNDDATLPSTYRLSPPSAEPTPARSHRRHLTWRNALLATNFRKAGLWLRYDAPHSCDALVSSVIKLPKLEVSCRQFTYCDDIPLNPKCSSLSCLWAWSSPPGMETLATDGNIHEPFVMLVLWEEIPSISWSWTDK